MLDLSNDQYNELLIYATKITAKNPHIIAGDVLNDLILSYLESSSSPSIADIKKDIRGRSMNIALSVRSLKNDIGFSKEYRKVCGKCKEELPVAMFRLFTNKHGVQLMQSYCKDCFNTYQKNYVKNRKRIDEEYRKKSNESARKRNIKQNAKEKFKRLTIPGYREFYNERQKMYRKKYKEMKNATQPGHS